MPYSVKHSMAFFFLQDMLCIYVVLIPDSVSEYYSTRNICKYTTTIFSRKLNIFTAVKPKYLDRQIRNIFKRLQNKAIHLRRGVNSELVLVRPEIRDIKELGE